MRWLIVIILSVVLPSAFGAHPNANRDGVMIEGYDPVSYFETSGPVKGNSKFKMKVNEKTYWFASEANLKKFEAAPAKYEPQYDGWCAYAVADSKSKVEVDPHSFLIQDGRLLLFYKGFFGNTREKWQQTKGKDATAYLKEADANWPETKAKTP